MARQTKPSEMNMLFNALGCKSSERRYRALLEAQELTPEQLTALAERGSVGAVLLLLEKAEGEQCNRLLTLLLRLLPDLRADDAREWNARQRELFLRGLRAWHKNTELASVLLQAMPVIGGTWALESVERLAKLKHWNPQRLRANYTKVRRETLPWQGRLQDDLQPTPAGNPAPFLKGTALTTMRADFPTILDSPAETYAEGLRFFRGEGMIQDTLRRLIADLEAYHIAYNVIGAVALNQHGYRRFTEYIDLLLTAEGLGKFQNELLGRGYRPAFNGAMRKFRETTQNVPIEIITSGEYPGDGKPKSVRFYDPGEHFVVIDGIKTVDLVHLVELKLASGMTGLARLKDLADVQELIRVRQLDVAFADQLDPFVADRYRELYAEVAAANAQEERE